jgi:hypothetical protein
MNKIISSTLLIVFFLVGCQPTPPAPTPTPISTLPSLQHQDTATWQVRVEKMVTFSQPNWIRCTNCNVDDPNDKLNLPAGGSFLVLTINVINKSTFTSSASPFSFGITMASSPQDCARTGDTMELCAVEGIKLGGKMYVPKGNGMFPFMKAFKIDPNTPAGETVEIYFVIKTGKKVATFQFLSLPPIDVSALNP